MKPEDLSSLFRKVPIAIVISSPDGHVLDCTDYTLKLIGRRREDTIGKYFLDLTPIEDIEKSIKLFKQLVQGEIDEYSITKSYISSSGEKIPVVSKVFAVRDENNKLKYAIVVITKREGFKSESSEKVYKYIFNKSAIPLALLTKDGTVVNVNEAFLKEVTFKESFFFPSKVWNIFQNEVQVEKQLHKFFLQNQDRIEMHVTLKNSRSCSVFIERIENSDYYLLSIPDEISKSFVLHMKLPSNFISLEALNKLNLKLCEGKNCIYRSTYNKFDTIVLLSEDLIVKEIDIPQELFESRVKGDEVVYINRTPVKDEIVFSSNSIREIEKFVLNKHISEIFKEEAIPSIESFLGNYTEEISKEFSINLPEVNDRKFFEVRGQRKEDNYVLIIRDITHYKKYEELLEKEKELLMKEVLEKRRFWATVSHEIRTPLHSIIGFSEFLNQTQLTTSQREYLEVIRSSSENLLSLINDVLEFSKMEEQDQKIEEDEVNLDDEINATLRMLLTKIKAKNIHVVKDFDLKIPYLVVTDRYKFRRILLNLIDNAIKFSPSDSEIIVSSYLVEDSKGFCKIKFSVRDFGIGIPKEKLNDIFKPFSQIDNDLTRRYQGTGLGLAICKRMIEVLGGTIEVFSEVGKGSIFSFYLPFRKLSSQKIEDKIKEELDKMNLYVFVQKGVLSSLSKVYHPKLSFFNDLYELNDILKDNSLLILDDIYTSVDDFSLLNELKNRFKNVKIVFLTDTFIDLGKGVFDFVIDKNSSIFEIFKVVIAPTREVEDFKKEDILEKLKGRNIKALVIEDNLVNAIFISKALESIGIEVHIVSHSRNALNKVMKGDYDIVFMDVQMPEIDGYTLTREIRKLNLEKRPVIVGISAQAFREDIQEGLRSGMDEYLTKPVRIQKIYEVIAKYFITGSFEVLENKTKIEEIFVSEDSFRRLKSFTTDQDFFKFMDSLLSAFELDFDKDIKKLALAHKNNSLEDIKKVAHKLKGSCYELGFLKLGDIFSSIEINAREGKDIVEEELLNEINLVKKNTIEKFKKMLEKES